MDRFIEHEEKCSPDGVPVRVPVDDGYRTCSVCGGDREPDSAFGSDEHDARIAFVCPKHGAQSQVDPFKHLRE